MEFYLEERKGLGIYRLAINQLIYVWILAIHFILDTLIVVFLWNTWKNEFDIMIYFILFFFKSSY